MNCSNPNCSHVAPCKNPSKWYAGIDPGEYGAMALYMPEWRLGDYTDKGFLYIEDLRQNAPGTGRAQSRMKVTTDSYRLLARRLEMVFESYGKPELCLVETPHSLPSDGHVGAFTFGKACGLIEGVLHGLDVPQLPTVPAVWKAQIGVTSVKSSSINKAIALFKDVQTDQDYEKLFSFPKAMADGRAEAALLAYLAATKYASFTKRTSEGASA